jgi:predicted acyl esterase
MPLGLRRRKDACVLSPPAKFSPSVDSFDYGKREVMIPMRDGVKLQTVITGRAAESAALPTRLQACS